MQTQEFVPDWFSPPHETIIELLTSRQIPRTYFAEMLEVSQNDANAILLGEIGIQKPLAEKLHTALGGSTDFWLQRQAQFDASVERAKSNFSEVQKGEFIRSYPIRELAKVGYVHDANDDFSSMLKFFDVSTPKEWDRRYESRKTAVAFRRSHAFKKSIDKTLLWLRQAERKAELLNVATWDKDRLLSSFDEIKRLTWVKQPQRFFPKLQDICASAGVAVVAVRTPSNSPCSGATFFSEKGVPVIVLSFRHRSDDHFWFSLFHEFGHLIMHDDHSIFLEGTEELTFEQEEEEANDFASQILVPSSRRSEMSTLPLNKNAIIAYAKSLGISAGIIVGQLQYLGHLRFNQMNHIKRRYTEENVIELF
jgi:Zn-dependent peptidase ImmA (M78 family)/plasmid maintenance system antidote protein VapI